MNKIISPSAKAIYLLACCLSTRAVTAQTGAPAASSTTTYGKQLYLPAKVWMVPDSNDYKNDASAFSYKRMATSDNVALFWTKTLGDNPLQHPDSTKRFSPSALLAECERFYNYYVNDLQSVQKGKSVTDSFKILIYVIDSKDGTAFGGGEDNKVGILWTPPARISKAPYGALAHELGHCFQYLVHADGAWGFTGAPEGSHGQTIFEMTSQYMLWQVYPEWMTFENYHLKSYLKQTHYAFLHENNQYHSPYVLEYWSAKHGKNFIGKLWKESVAGEDPVLAYQRLTGINQKEFNNEMFDAACHFITWDMPRIEQIAAQYANTHTTRLDSTHSGWLRITPDQCIQNYGYNGIQLQVPATGTKVTVQFRGIKDDTAFRAIHAELAGWRYGFVAVKADGSRVYGKACDKANGKISFSVPENTRYLWLVVSGAPTKHWQHITDGKPDNDEQWPYEIQLTGTALAK